MAFKIISKKQMSILLFPYAIIFTMSNSTFGSTIGLLSANTVSEETTKNSAGVNEFDHHALDTLITSKVKAIFLKDPILKYFDIHVQTDNSMVRLSGTVNSTVERDRAVKLTLDIKKVVAVINAIQVR